MSLKFLMFGFVGAVGFLVDGGVLTYLMHEFNMPPYLARLFSFSCATLVTWILNRTFVFTRIGAQNNRGEEYVRYLSVQMVGALINLFVFMSLLHVAPEFKQYPIIPLALGAVFGMIFNYTASKIWVFKRVKR